MCADGNAVLYRQSNRLPKDAGISAVETGGDVGRRDGGHQRLVITDDVNSEGFADVGVQVDGHGAQALRSSQRARARLSQKQCDCTKQEGTA